MIFEYELPLNFTHDCDLPDTTFYALKSGVSEQYFGFRLANATDKTSLTQKMKQLAKLLCKNKR